MYGGNGPIIGGGLAVTGLALPLGWYFVAGVLLLAAGFILVRMALRSRQRRALHSAH